LDGALTLAANQHTWSEELLLAVHRRVRLVGAIHHPAFHVATGRVDVAILTHQAADDLAPLPVILAEAGGRVTGLDGRPVSAGDGSALLTNGLLHDDLLQAMAGLAHTSRPKALDR
jgi:histidinol-phosphatase